MKRKGFNRREWFIQGKASRLWYEKQSAILSWRTHVRLQQHNGSIFYASFNLFPFCPLHLFSHTNELIRGSFSREKFCTRNFMQQVKLDWPKFHYRHTIELFSVSRVILTIPEQAGNFKACFHARSVRGSCRLHRRLRLRWTRFHFCSCAFS